MWSSFLIALVLAAGENPEPAPAAPPPPAPTRVDAPKLDRLPDGTFSGPLVGASEGLTLHLTVVHGLVTRFELHRPGTAGGGPMELKPHGSPHDVGLRFGGRADDSFIKVSGAFWERERALGSFEGTLDKKRVQGTWRLAKR